MALGVHALLVADVVALLQRAAALCSGTGSGTIYWDANGGSAADAVAFAKITGTTLLPSDFHVV